MKENCPIDNKSVVETIIKRLCENRLDITEPYDNWLRIGFAFADEFGECGRQYYHRVSQFHPQYSSKECDEQYNACLKSHGRGVTIATLPKTLALIFVATTAPMRKQRKQRKWSKHHILKNLKGYIYR